MKARCRICGKSESRWRPIVACIRCWCFTCPDCLGGDKLHCKGCFKKETS